MGQQHVGACCGGFGYGGHRGIEGDGHPSERQVALAHEQARAIPLLGILSREVL